MKTLSDLLQDYLAMRRGLGFQLKSAGTALLSFIEYMEKCDAPYITNELALSWVTQSKNVKANHLTNRLGFVRGFAKYCRAIDQCSQIPPSELLPSRKERTSPYLFSDADLGQLLQRSLEQDGSAVATNSTIHCILSLLSVTGLRISEALRLDVSDFDATEGILHIQDSKFGKSRLLPLHPSGINLLAQYLLSRPNTSDTFGSIPMFCSTNGKRMLYDTIYRKFRRLSSDFPDQPGRRRPRLHDLRHRFVVKTLLNWYRTGADVQQLLPVLSTYMGHVEVRDTYWYISACPELMEAAKQRLDYHWESTL